MPNYPPEPWNLAGDAHLSVWQVPADRLPRLPGIVTPVTLGGRALVVTAWIDYRPPGEMSYHELLATVAVRRGVRPTGSITEIWVDSEASLAGGRELWGIPKDLATLTFTGGRGFTGSASTERDWIATAAFASRCGPPASLPASFAIVQSVHGTPLASRVTSRGRPRLASARWNINPAGPLGYLAGRKPLLSAQLLDFRLRFGGRA